MENEGRLHHGVYLDHVGISSLPSSRHWRAPEASTHALAAFQTYGKARYAHELLCRLKKLKFLYWWSSLQKDRLIRENRTDSVLSGTDCRKTRMSGSCVWSLGIEFRKIHSIKSTNIGWSAWESNPPVTVLAPHTGFEVPKTQKTENHNPLINGLVSRKLLKTDEIVNSIYSLEFYPFCPFLSFAVNFITILSHTDIRSIDPKLAQMWKCHGCSFIQRVHFMWTICKYEQ